MPFYYKENKNISRGKITRKGFGCALFAFFFFFLPFYVFSLIFFSNLIGSITVCAHQGESDPV